MDRRSDPTNELYEFAREAYACSDYEQAVYFLRKASALAPMRQDIRQFLAEVLAQGTSGGNSHSSAEPSSTSFPRPSPRPVLTEDEEDVSTPRTTTLGSAPLQNSLRRLMARLPLRPFQNTEEQEEESTPEPDSVPVARIEPVPLAPLTAAAPAASRPARSRVTLGVTEDDSEPLSFPVPEEISAGAFESADPAADEPSRRGLPERPAEDTAPSSSRTLRLSAPSPKKASRRETRATEPEEVSALETVSQWLAGLPAPPRRTVAFSAAYLAAALFTATACLQCYSKFFREVRPTAGSAISAATVAALPPAVSAPVAAPMTRPASAAPAPVAPAQAPAAAPIVQSKPAPDPVEEARAALRRGKLDEAARILKASPPAKTSSSRQLLADLAKAYDQKGTELLKKSDFSQAVEHYSKACGFASSNADYALHLGNAYYYLAKRSSAPAERKNWSEKAVESLQRTLELQSGNVEALHRLATVHALADQYPQARECWTRALASLKQSLSRNGKKVETYQRMAMILECLGRTSEARSAYESILKLADPRSEAAADARFGLKALGNKK